MFNLIVSSPYFGVSITLITFSIGLLLKKKLKHSIFNPLLISTILIILFLVYSKTSYDQYYVGGQYIKFLMTPTTVCLAIPLYKELHVLKKHLFTVLVSITLGTLSSLVSIFLLAKLFSLSYTNYASLLPKSITSAIGAGLSVDIGGHPAITIAAIVLTGIFGSVMSNFVFRFLKIKNPISRGLALGTSCHAMGAAKAFEYGEIEEGFASLSIVVAGIITVILAPIFASFLL